MTTANETRRLELIDVCQRNDRNGVWTDEDCDAEGISRSTPRGLTDTIVAWLWDAAIGELRREREETPLLCGRMTAIVRSEFAALFGRQAMPDDEGVIAATIACVVFSDYGDDPAFDIHKQLDKGSASAWAALAVKGGAA